MTDESYREQRDPSPSGEVRSLVHMVARAREFDREIAKQEAARPAGYTDLHVTQSVHLLCGYAKEMRDVVLIYGPHGSGKTYALERYCVEHAGAWYVAMSPSVNTPSAVSACIAEALGFGGVAGSAHELERVVIRNLRADGSLLIIDEAHHLGEVLLDQVRCIYDKARCGLVLAGNDPLLTRIASGKAAALYSRVGMRQRVKRPSRVDALALAETLAKRELGDAGATAVLKVSRGSGGLRGVAKLIDVAALMARGHGGKTVSDDDLVAAAESMGPSPQEETA